MRGVLVPVMIRPSRFSAASFSIVNVTISGTAVDDSVADFAATGSAVSSDVAGAVTGASEVAGDGAGAGSGTGSGAGAGAGPSAGAGAMSSVARSIISQRSASVGSGDLGVDETPFLAGERTLAGVPLPSPTNEDFRPEKSSILSDSGLPAPTAAAAKASELVAAFGPETFFAEQRLKDFNQIWT
jgi:hypothetical protein